VHLCFPPNQLINLAIAVPDMSRKLLVTSIATTIRDYRAAVVRGDDDEAKRLLREWQERVGEDSMHEMAFGEWPLQAQNG